MKKLGILGTSWYYSFNEQLSRKLLFFSRIGFLPENSIHARSHDPIVYRLNETDKRKRGRLFLYCQIIVLVIGISSLHTRQYSKNEIPWCNLINKHCKSRFNVTLVLNRFINWMTQSFIIVVSGLSETKTGKKPGKIEEEEHEQIQNKAESHGLGKKAAVSVTPSCVTNIRVRDLWRELRRCR